MTQQSFLQSSGRIAVVALVLIAALRLGFGPQWFGLYGWATVALAAVPPLGWLLWKRLPDAGRSRWWSLAFCAPIIAGAIVQILFWLMFFAQGPTNPMLGVMRELVRPWLDAGLPFVIAAVLGFGLWLWIAAARARAG